MKRILEWCSSIVGPCQIVSGDPRPDARSSTYRLQAGHGHCYLKLHRDRSCWDQEVHGYEQWAPVFGPSAPPLLALHEEEPLALLIGELAGTVLENVRLPAEQERTAWRTAGVKYRFTYMR